MKKKVGTLWSVLLIFALLLAACATPAAEETPVPPVVDTPAVDVTPPMEETAPPEDTEMVPPTGPEETPEATQPAEGEMIGGTVSVLAVWGGSEQESFEAMVQPFEEQTGVDVLFEGTRDLNQVLTSRVQGGNPPDIAGLPGPGQLIEYAQAGNLQPLNDVLDMDQLGQNYDPGFVNLATVDDQLYGIFIKASVKSLIWYRPDVFDERGYQIPTTWEELNNLEQQIISEGGTPWCIGVESGAASGWPGTDWIEDIMLRTAGVDTYDQWWQHEIPWTDDAVRNAWSEWGTVVNDEQMLYGGTTYVLSTNFGEAPFPMFDDPPGCFLHRQASFITDFIQEQFPDLVPGEDYDFFIFPPIDEQHGNPLLVAGDLFGMFNDTPQARALMQYLTTAEAQQIWAERGGFIAPNRNVPPDVYPDVLSQRVSEELTGASSVRFDASDLMPAAVNDAFWTGILEFIGNPDNLDSILENIESTAQGAYTQ